MDTTTKPLFSGPLAVVLGTVGALMMFAAPVIPSPYGIPAGIVGFVLAYMAGHAVKPPSWAAGNPILQGVALTIGKGLYAVLIVLIPSMPAGWPQASVSGVAGLVAFLVGYASPQIGTNATSAEATPAVSPPSTTLIADSQGAAAVFGSGPKA